MRARIAGTSTLARGQLSSTCATSVLMASVVNVCRSMATVFPRRLRTSRGPVLCACRAQHQPPYSSHNATHRPGAPDTLWYHTLHVVLATKGLLERNASM